MEVDALALSERKSVDRNYFSQLRTLVTGRIELKRRTNLRKPMVDPASSTSSGSSRCCCSLTVSGQTNSRPTGGDGDSMPDSAISSSHSLQPNQREARDRRELARCLLTNERGSGCGIQQPKQTPIPLQRCA